MLVNPSETRLAVIATHEIAREGLRRILLDEGFITETLTAGLFIGDEPGLDPHLDPHPHLVIVSATTVEHGIEICRAVRSRFPTSRLMLLTTAADLGSLARALSAGVDGYMTSEISCDRLVGALRLVLMGEKIVPTQSIDALVAAVPVGAPRSIEAATMVNLSGRERIILERLIFGEANKLISRHLAISEATVKIHVKSLLRKLGVLNRTQAAIWGKQQGFSVDN